jgi:translation initiation factor IF-2
VPVVAAMPPKPTGPPREITLTEGVTVKELSEKIEIKAKDVMRVLMQRGLMATINQPLEPEMAKEIAGEFNCTAEIITFEEDVQRQVLDRPERSGDDQRPRPPVVTIMGHVDHGKTSLLDAIRKSNIIAGEAGGITQHIGAYHVEVNGRNVSFLDTPGHEAFTLMRSRGAQVTDIVVLVVAADDGVMPQTREAVDHARAAGVPIVVAVNKMDKPDAKLDQVKQQLAELELTPEDWGGQTVFVPMSAKQGSGLDQLLEMLLLVADMADLKADPTVPASGVVLEARLDRARGAVASVLVQNGTLRVGDPFIAGHVSGKVRAMFDENGARVGSAGPSIPVEVTGLDGIPEAGDTYQVLDEERRARMIGSQRQTRLREERMKRAARPTLDGLFQQIQEGQIKELSLILKSDVQGSSEVLQKSLRDLSTDKVKVRLLHAGIGAITESDVLLATSSGAIVIGFNVRPERSATELAEKEGVDIRFHNVIYNVTKEIQDAMVGLLDPTLQENFLGRAEVRDTFKVPKAGLVAGCYVTDGKVPSGSQVRLLRDSTVVYEGKIASLRRFKEDTSEVREGYECGIGLERFQDVKVGDVIEAFQIEKIAAQSL